MKTIIAKQEGLTVDEQELAFRGQRLKNDNTMSSYGIGVGSEIWLAMWLYIGIKPSWEKDERTFNICIQTLNGHSFAMRVKRTDLVGNLKNFILKKVGIPVEAQVLTFQGQTMHNDSTLELYNVGNNDSVWLTLRLRGGGHGSTSTGLVRRTARWIWMGSCATFARGADAAEASSPDHQLSWRDTLHTVCLAIIAAACAVHLWQLRPTGAPGSRSPAPPAQGTPAEPAHSPLHSGVDEVEELCISGDGDRDRSSTQKPQTRARGRRITTVHMTPNGECVHPNRQCAALVGCRVVNSRRVCLVCGDSWTTD